MVLKYSLNLMMKHLFYGLVEVLLKKKKTHEKFVYLSFYYLLGWTYKRFFSIQSVLDSNSSSNQ